MTQTSSLPVTSIATSILNMLNNANDVRMMDYYNRAKSKNSNVIINAKTKTTGMGRDSFKRSHSNKQQKQKEDYDSRTLTSLSDDDNNIVRINGMMKKPISSSSAISAIGQQQYQNMVKMNNNIMSNNDNIDGLMSIWYRGMVRSALYTVAYRSIVSIIYRRSGYMFAFKFTNTWKQPIHGTYELLHPGMLFMATLSAIVRASMTTTNNNYNSSSFDSTTTNIFSPKGHGETCSTNNVCYESLDSIIAPETTVSCDNSGGGGGGGGSSTLRILNQLHRDRISIARSCYRSLIGPSTGRSFVGSGLSMTIYALFQDLTMQTLDQQHIHE